MRKYFPKTNKTKLPLEHLHCGASLSPCSSSCSLFLPFKWLAESLNTQNRQLKTTQSTRSRESKTWRCTLFTHLWLHFFFSQLDEGHTGKVHGFCQWRSYKNLNKQTNKNQKIQRRGGRRESAIWWNGTRLSPPGCPGPSWWRPPRWLPSRWLGETPAGGPTASYCRGPPSPAGAGQRL